MSSFFLVAPVKRTAAMAGLLGAIMLATPLAPAVAQSATKTSAEAKATTSAETVEQRIAALHTQLKITAAEEGDWKAVAQTMRDNAAAIQKIAADKATQSKEGMTALEDLQTYQTFTQAHLDGIKSLTAAFTTLYNSMPDTQKKIADQVFQSSRHQGAGKSS
jgi:hypothetical protein